MRVDVSSHDSGPDAGSARLSLGMARCGRSASACAPTRFSQPSLRDVPYASERRPLVSLADGNRTCVWPEVSHMAMDRIEVITSVGRRRRWSASDKARLVAAMGEPDAVVTEIARSASVEASLLYP